jgi:hypothetical protein
MLPNVSLLLRTEEGRRNARPWYGLWYRIAEDVQFHLNAAIVGGTIRNRTGSSLDPAGGCRHILLNVRSGARHCIGYGLVYRQGSIVLCTHLLTPPLSLA